MKSWWPVVAVGVASIAFVGFLVLAGLAAAGLVGKGSAPTCDASTGSGGSGGKLYMIGDSITVGLDSDQGKLKPHLSAKGYDPTVEAVGGKMLTWGIDVVKNKKEQLKDTKTFVVELGTNYYTGEDTRFDNEVEDMISAIKAANNDAKIYWVNIISESPYRSKFNQVLESKSGSLGFTVIDLYKDRDKIAMEPDKIHPSWDGSDTYAKLVVEGLGESGSGGSTCQTQSGSVETVEELDGLRIPYPSTKVGVENHLVDGLTGPHYVGPDSKPLNEEPGGGAYKPYSPEQERWFFNEAWDGNGCARGVAGMADKKLLVTSVKTKKQVVVSVQECGPAKWVTDQRGVGAGASPEVIRALGIPVDNGESEDSKITVRFVKDQQGTKLGPVN